ncbi:MAG: fused response regulator/phosphatase [Gemmataceae bacterium]|nr:fused response regulator/phosphatase [Gemmataceae bacterium]
MSRPVTVLLVDDQPIVAAQVKQMLAGEDDLVLHYCPDPTQAIDTANRVQPTVILQDLVMPDIDGLMLVKFFRANKATRDVPMIVLSSKEDPAIKAKAFAQGANDYLVKLPDKLEVVARIRYHSRGYVALLERNEAYARLAEEIDGAARYVKSLLPAPLEGKIGIGWRFVPSTQLGGDMFGYHWLDKTHLALYLLDVSGHGVGSSLLAVSATNVLSSRALAGTDFKNPGAVVSKLNDVFQMERQNGKYFTIWYGVFHKTSRVLSWCNAAHPDALLHTGADAGSAELRRLAPTDTLVGMLPPGMPFRTEKAELGPYARLLLYSDGAFEVERPDKTMWTHKEFIEFAAGLFPDGEPLPERLLAKARDLHGGDVLADDCSFVEARL